MLPCSEKVESVSHYATFRRHPTGDIVGDFYMPTRCVRSSMLLETMLETIVDNLLFVRWAIWNIKSASRTAFLFSKSAAVRVLSIKAYKVDLLSF